MARILIVEDEPITAADLELKLAALGHEVAGWVDTGEDAVAQAPSLHPDLVLMDIRLAGAMDGIEAAAHLREQSPVPLVFLTAFADAETVDRACATEPFGYLLKPFTERSVATAVQVALTRARAEQGQADRERWAAAALAGAGEALRSAGEALVAVDGQGTIRFLNGHAESLLGVRADAAVGRDGRALVRLAASPGDPRHPLDVALQDGTIVSAPHVMLTAGGDPARAVNVAYSAAPVTTAGGRRGAVIVLREEVPPAAARRPARSDAVAALTRTLSHEVNNPLTYNLGALQLAIRELDHLRALGALEPGGADTGAAQRESTLLRIESLLRDAHEGASRVAGVMRDLGSFSLSERDRVPVSPPEVIDLAIGLAAAAPPQVKLIRRIEAGPMVLGNRWQLARVVAFALQHVADAVSPDDPAASIQLTVGVDPRGWARFVVDGRGPRAPLAATRAATSPATDVVREGSVAMAIAEHVVDEHGGAMRFRDGTGGREVEIVLPPVRRGVVAERRSAAPGEMRGRVLIVDDEPMIGRVLEITLQPEHDVKAVTSAEGALALLERGDAFDVILCDLSMPGMTGQDLHDHLRRSRPTVASRMIFMSAGARTPEGAAFLETVADRRIDKPFRTDQLLPLVRERVRAVRARAD